MAQAESDAQHQEWEAAERQHGSVVHACPSEGSGVMPCCDRSPFEVPRWHRMTLDASQVTCGRAGDEPSAEGRT